MAEQAVEEKLARLAAGSPIVLEQIKPSLHRSASLTLAQALTPALALSDLDPRDLERARS